VRRKTHDQKTEIRQVSALFAKEKSEDWKTKKSRDIQQQSRGEETRTRGSIFQTAMIQRGYADSKVKRHLQASAKNAGLALD
jgi:5-methylthioribose kinase